MSCDDAPLLEVAGLRVEYEAADGPVPAVDGVDLSVEAGETLGLVGESGAGKSTALMALPGILPAGAKVLPPSSVRLGGTELIGASASTLRSVRGSRIGVIFQQPGSSLNPVRRVGSQVAEAVRRGRGLSRPDVEPEVHRLLGRAGLDDPERVADAYPDQLSGGMQQRVGLAAAVGGGPGLLLADEPTAALDVALEAEVLARLDRLQSDGGMGMILVSHDLRVVAGVADRVAVMYAGRVVEEGPAEEVLGDPAHPYTEGLLEAAPRLDGPPGLTPAIPGEPPRAGERPEGCRFRPRCRHAWERCRGEPGLLDGPTVSGRGRRVRCWLAEEPARRAAREESAHPGRGRSRAGTGGSGGEEDPLLRAEGLSRVYRASCGRGGGVGSVRAVADVSLRVAAGEAVGLVGESGAGKSTLARMMTGAERPDDGRLRWRGRPVARMDRAERGEFRRGAQLLHQDFHASLNPRMTVGAALREPLLAHGLAEGDGARRRAAELLERVGLPAEAAERRPRELSGGQRQRAALARALTVRPRLLAADEPVSALDVSVQARVLTLLAELSDRLGLALVLVAHDLAVVRQLCDRVVVLHRGRVVERSATERLLRSPEHPQTRRLVEAARSRGLEFP